MKNVWQLAGLASSWANHIVNRYQTEFAYWSNLPYQNFVSQWNNPEINPSKAQNTRMSSAGALVTVGGVAVAAQPEGPGEGAFVLLGLAALGLVCLGALEIALTIPFPARQTIDFGKEIEKAVEKAIPIPNPDNFPDCTKEMPDCEALEEGGGTYTVPLTLLLHWVRVSVRISMSEKKQMNSILSCRPWHTFAVLSF